MVIGNNNSKIIQWWVRTWSSRL